MINRILRIIDAVKTNNVDMAVRYAESIVPEDEKEDVRALVEEAFKADPKSLAVMDSALHIVMMPDEHVKRVVQHHFDNADDWQSGYMQGGYEYLQVGYNACIVDACRIVGNGSEEMRKELSENLKSVLIQ